MSTSTVISGILGFLYSGTFDNTKTYEKNQYVVDSNGYYWLAISDIPAGNTPSTSSTYWKKLINFDAELTAPTENVQTLGSLTANTTIDAGLGNIVSFTVGAAITITLTANSGTRGRILTLIITNGGAYTVTWPTTIKWDSGAAPSMQTAGTDVVTLMSIDNGTSWIGLQSYTKAA